MAFTETYVHTVFKVTTRRNEPIEAIRVVDVYEVKDGDQIVRILEKPSAMDPKDFAGVLPTVTQMTQERDAAKAEAQSLKTERDQLRRTLKPPIMRQVGDVTRWMNEKGKGTEALNWLQDNPGVNEINVKDDDFVAYIESLNLDPMELHSE